MVFRPFGASASDGRSRMPFQRISHHYRFTLTSFRDLKMSFMPPRRLCDTQGRHDISYVWFTHRLSRLCILDLTSSGFEPRDSLTIIRRISINEENRKKPIYLWTLLYGAQEVRG
jgi:hypothetical protein